MEEKKLALNFVNPSTGAPPEETELCSDGRELARRVFKGESVFQASKRMKLGYIKALRISKSSPFKCHMLKLQEAADREVVDCVSAASRRIALESLSSVEKIVQLRDSSEAEDIQLRSAQDLLNRAGIGKGGKDEQSGPIAISNSKVLLMMDTAKESDGPIGVRTEEKVSG